MLSKIKHRSLHFSLHLTLFGSSLLLHAKGIVCAVSLKWCVKNESLCRRQSVAESVIIIHEAPSLSWKRKHLLSHHDFSLISVEFPTPTIVEVPFWLCMPERLDDGVVAMKSAQQLKSDSERLFQSNSLCIWNEISVDFHGKLSKVHLKVLSMILEVSKPFKWKLK